MNIQKHIDEYLVYLKKEITYSNAGKYYEINLPFLDNNNDYLQFYVKEEAQQIYFTDDGQTLYDLEMNGINLTNPIIINQIKFILSKYNAMLEGKEIISETLEKDFAKSMHMFIQCLIKISLLIQ